MTASKFRMYIDKNTSNAIVEEDLAEGDLIYYRGTEYTIMKLKEDTVRMEAYNGVSTSMMNIDIYELTKSGSEYKKIV